MEKYTLRDMSIYPTSGPITFSSLPGYFQDSSAANPIALSEFNEFIGVPNQAPYPAIGSISLAASSIYGKARGTPGLMYKIFKGNYAGNVTYFDSAELVATGITQDFTSISAATGGYVSETTAWENYSIEWTGLFYAEQPKDVCFGITSNASCKLYVNNSLVVDTDAGTYYNDPGVTLPTVDDQNAGRWSACYPFRIVYGLSTGTGTFSLIIQEYYGVFPDYDEFTRNLLTPYYLPPSGLVGWYDVGSWTGTQWTDKSGAGNHATTTTGTISTDGYTLSGTTTSGIRFPTSILPTTYTLFYVARYSGATKQRIFNGVNSNWLSGFWGWPGASRAGGDAYHSDATGWVSGAGDLFGTNWVVGTDQNTLYRSNGKLRGTAAAGNSDRLSINWGYVGEPSDWAVSEVIVYNRTLSITEIKQVEGYLFTKKALQLHFIFDMLSAAGRAAVRSIYSIRRLSVSYAGPVIGVRRESDNATNLVYADFYGNLALSYGGTGTSLGAWANGNTFVYAWYDQSGNTKHAIQATAGSQPVINIAARSINFRTSKFIDLPNATVPSGNSAYTVAVKHNAIDVTNGTWLSSGGTATVNGDLGFRRNATGYLDYWYGNDYASGTYAANVSVVNTYNGSQRQVFVDGVASTAVAASGRNSGTLLSYIGKNYYGEYLNGDLYYLHIFSSVLAANDRSCIVSV